LRMQGRGSSAREGAYRPRIIALSLLISGSQDESSDPAQPLCMAVLQMGADDLLA